MEGVYFGIKTANPLLSNFCDDLSFEQGFTAFVLLGMDSNAEKLIYLHVR